MNTLFLQDFGGVILIFDSIYTHLTVNVLMYLSTFQPLQKSKCECMCVCVCARAPVFVPGFDKNVMYNYFHDFWLNLHFVSKVVENILYANITFSDLWLFSRGDCGVTLNIATPDSHCHP